MNVEKGAMAPCVLVTNLQFTIIKDRKKELDPGLLKKMLADLGLTKSDIE